MILKILVALSLLSTAYAQISKVKNVKITPKVQAESSAVVITWDVPATLGGNTESDLKYKVKYCEINRKETCKESDLLSERKYEITGLKKNFIYSYHITAYGKDNAKGEEESQVFKTENRDTCASNLYTCKLSDQCIPPERKCDGIVGCADGSDENADAGCTVPADRPGNLKVEDVKKTSFVVKFNQIHARNRVTDYEIEILSTAANTKTTRKETHSNFGVPVKSVSVTGLSDGTEYKVRVRALNRVGAGPFSSEVTVTTIGTPLKVKNVKIVAKPLQETTAFTLTWDQPADLAGNSESDIKYMVTYCEINKPTTCINTTLSAERKVEISGLKPNFIYSYHINTFGKDNQKGSEYSQVYTTESKITCLPNQFTCVQSSQCTEAQKTCDGIVNCADGSDEGASAKCKIPAEKPSEIKAEGIKADSFTLKFKQVGQPDRATGYEIEVLNTKTNSKVIQKDTHSKLGFAIRTISINGLEGNTDYKVRIRAVNRVGPGLFSDYVTIKTTGSASKLSQVLNVKATPKVNAETSAVIVEWDPPANLDGNSESDLKYAVKYCEINKESTCKTTDISASRRVELKDLKKDFIYNYHVIPYGKNNAAGEETGETFKTRAKRTCLPSLFTCTQSDGCIEPKKLCDGITNCGDASDEGKAAECTPPKNVPTGLSITDVTETSIKFKYTQVPQPDRAVNYDIEIVDVSAGSTINQATIHEKYGINFKSIDIPGLKPSTKYRIRIRANNRVGNGPWSQFESATTKGVGEVSNVKETSAINTIRLVWEAPKDLNGKNPSTFQYMIKYCEVNGDSRSNCKEIKTKDKFKTIRGLKAATTYEYEILALTADNQESLSYKRVFTTEEEEFKTSGPNNDSDGMSTAQKAGIAIGIVLAIILLIIGIFCCMRRKKGSKSQSRPPSGKQNGGYEMDKK